MRVKVSDYIAGRLVEAGISQVFTVTGGGAMHLNDALGFTIRLLQSVSLPDQGAPMPLPE